MPKKDKKRNKTTSHVADSLSNPLVFAESADHSKQSQTTEKADLSSTEDTEGAQKQREFKRNLASSSLLVPVVILFVAAGASLVVYEQFLKVDFKTKAEKVSTVHTAATSAQSTKRAFLEEYDISQSEKDALHAPLLPSATETSTAIAPVAINKTVNGSSDISTQSNAEEKRALAAGQHAGVGAPQEPSATPEIPSPILQSKISDLENKLTSILEENKKLSEKLLAVEQNQQQAGLEQMQKAQSSKIAETKMNVFLLIDTLKESTGAVNPNLFEQVLASTQDTSLKAAVTKAQALFAEGKIQAADLKEVLTVAEAQIFAETENTDTEKSLNNENVSQTEDVSDYVDSGMSIKSWAKSFLSRYIRVRRLDEKTPTQTALEELGDCLAEGSYTTCLQLVQNTSFLKTNKNLESFKQGLVKAIEQEKAIQEISLFLKGGRL